LLYVFFTCVSARSAQPHYAYVADKGAGLQVIDVSDLANPQRVGGYDTSGDACGVAVSGNYAYVADYSAGLQVIEVSNPTNPQRVGLASKKRTQEWCHYLVSCFGFRSQWATGSRGNYGGVGGCKRSR